MGKKVEPLTESYFYILLCLAEGPNHGYGIMQKTKELSDGEVRIGSGTMYGATSNMMKKGWIVDSDEPVKGAERRRMYVLTEEGRGVLDAEIVRLKRLLSGAKEILEGRENG